MKLMKVLKKEDVDRPIVKHEAVLLLRAPQNEAHCNACIVAFRSLAHVTTPNIPKSASVMARGRSYRHEFRLRLAYHLPEGARSWMWICAAAAVFGRSFQRPCPFDPGLWFRVQINRPASPPVSPLLKRAKRGAICYLCST